MDSLEVTSGVSGEERAPLRVLVVDDSDTFCRLIERALGREYELEFAGNESQALEAAQRFEPHLVLLDLHLPPDTTSPRIGLKLLDEFKRSYPRTRVIVVSGTNERRDAMDAIAAGAADFYTKPIALDELRIVIKRNHQIIGLELENERLAQQMRERQEEADLIGSAPSFQRALALLRRVAPTEATVLLIGENGTGKELFARELHRASPRADGPFIAINCGAIPESLAEAELFGFVKGSFTGAAKDRIGRIEAAEGGTLFLDEVGELSEHLQAKLLRFLQEHQIQPIGANQTVDVDVRVVAATNRDLALMVKEGTFREDLYYRLNVIEVALPALRERREDIVLLANYFLTRNAELAGGRPLRIGSDGARWLETYPFPGNVRELENMVKRAILMAGSSEIRAEDFVAGKPAGRGAPQAGSPGDSTGSPPTAIAEAVIGEGLSLKDVRENAERAAVERALAEFEGNVTRTAEQLRVERKSLQRLIKRLDIDVSRFCPGGRTRRGRPPGSTARS